MEEQQHQVPASDISVADVVAFLHQLLSKWYWFAISVAVCMATAYLVNHYSDRMYSASGSVLVKNNQPMVGTEQFINGMVLSQMSNKVQNEVSILKSYTLARRAIESIPSLYVTCVGQGKRKIAERVVYERMPFTVALDTAYANKPNVPIEIKVLNAHEYRVKINNGHNISATALFGEPFRTGQWGFTLNWRNGFSPNNIYNSYTIVINDINKLTQQFQQQLKVTVNDKNGSLLLLSFSAAEPHLATDYLNALMQKYIQRGLDEKNQMAANTVAFIDRQLRSITDSLIRAEQNLQDFKQIKTVDISREGAILFEQIKETQNKLSDIDLRGRYYAYLRDYLDQRKDMNTVVAPSAMGLQDEQLTYMLNEINKTYIEREHLRSTVKGLSLSSVAQLDVKMDNLLKALNEKVNSLIEANNIALAEVQQKLEQLERSVRQLPANERQLLNFERDFGLINTMYTYMQQKRAEAAIAQASNVSDNSILDYAIAENAVMVRPRVLINYILAMLIALVVPLFIIIIMNLLRDKIVDLDAIGKRTSVPVLATVGHNTRPELVIPVVERPSSMLAESFRGLRTNLQYLLREPHQKVVSITSMVSGEGKTFVSLNLAAILAMMGKKVLVMGLDLRKPKMQEDLGYVADKGISTYLIGQHEAADIIVHTTNDNLTFVPTGAIPPNPAELIETERMAQFFEWARQNYDYVVVDTPPIGVVADAQLLARYSDANLFVVRYNHSHLDALSLVEDLRVTHMMEHINLVVNDVQAKKVYGSKHYGYGSGYGKNGTGYYLDEDAEPTRIEKIKTLTKRIIRFLKK